VTPFYFGTSRRRLFGIYDSPGANGSTNLRAAVLCNPWGPEYIHAHRSLRQLATRLSLAGFHILRFDYFGTGDSAGDLIDGDLAGWEEDVETAIEELTDLSGAKRVVLAGLRLGATLAASVGARRRKELDALVLLDPIVSGEAYLQDLGRSRGSERPASEGRIPRPLEGGGHEILGFPVTPKVAQELKSIDLIAQIPTMLVDTLILVSEYLPYHQLLERAVKQADKAPAIEYTEDLPVWVERPNNPGIIPVDTLHRVVHWLLR
jgi:uncharacterized protein